MVDLHTHSTASDGEKSPSELVFSAKESGLSVLALTDHDTLDGLEEAAAAAKKAGLIFVPGIELNIEWPTGEFHLLGLGLKEISASMKALAKALKDSRVERNKKIFAALENDGLDVNYEEFARAQTAFHAEDSLGRPHIAAYMVQKGIVKNRQKAFDKYLSNGTPFFVDFEGADLTQAVKAILDSGGLPVIAHPLSLYVGWGKIEEVLRGIKDAGVQGLEAWHPGAKENDCRRLEKMAREMGFFVTAGSDYHGPNVRGDRKLGRTAGGYKIDDRFYFEELLPRL
ncbi:MAG: PHP domain-containing protein [Treponema sp.]|nr:PHP domain-containing protein [Treponema sp.]